MTAEYRSAISETHTLNIPIFKYSVSHNYVLYLCKIRPLNFNSVSNSSKGPYCVCIARMKVRQRHRNCNIARTVSTWLPSCFRRDSIYWNWHENFLKSFLWLGFIWKILYLEIDFSFQYEFSGITCCHVGKLGPALDCRVSACTFKVHCCL